MKLFRWLNLITILTLLTACGINSNGDGGIPLFGPTPTLRPPHVGVTPAPDANPVVKAYFDSLKNNDYAGMYNLLTRVSRDALNKMSATSFDYEILSSLLSPDVAQIGYRITYHTALVGDLQREIVMRLA